MSKPESRKWEVPDEMADYVNYQFELFIPTCARKPKVPGSSPAASYVQR